MFLKTLRQAVREVFMSDEVKKAVRSWIDESGNSQATVQSLKDQAKNLEHKIRELEHKKELEETELDHLIKMKEEKQTLEIEKRSVALQKEFNQKEMDLQRKYHEQTVGIINKEHADIKDIYRQIMERLPNVNVELKRKS